jgi:hypothetical protein
MENICKIAFRIQLVLFCAVNAQTIDKDWFTDILGENNGHTTCTFLSLPSSAGAMGTGCIATTGMLDATDVHSFTAATALAENNQFALNHLEWYMGLRNEFAGATFPLLSIGTIAGLYRGIRSVCLYHRRTAIEFFHFRMRHRRVIRAVLFRPEPLRRRIGLLYRKPS